MGRANGGKGKEISMAKTIDNLGPEVSTRYAEDKRLYDSSLVKEARVVPLQTEIDVTLPSYPSEFDQLFETAKRNIFWAGFFAPPKFNEQKKRLFTHQAIPSLGSPDKKEALAVRISEIVAKAQQKREQALKENRPLAWQDERELEEEEKEKRALLSLITQVGTIERTFLDINSRRSQYHKG